jgi:glucuronokinase
MADAEPPGRGVAFARAALAGNPSDGYGGAVLAVTLDGHAARAVVNPAPVGQARTTPPSKLVTATVRRFARRCPEAADSDVRWGTSIPRAVGLGGSSAIVIATLRALCQCYSFTLSRSDMASLALSVETEDLGIAAGLQDRVAQAYEGLTFMDFAAGRYERLDPGLLPPLVIAWRAHAAQDSGRVHGDLRIRFAQGESRVRDAMTELARLAGAARSALLNGDLAGFADCVDASFEARARMLVLDPSHVEMVEVARRAGASANYTGSGGAIVCVCRDDTRREAVAAALAAAGCGITSRQSVGSSPGGSTESANGAGRP